jgi:putative tryptophan/tyrosine transport system substrate-binding protein
MFWPEPIGLSDDAILDFRFWIESQENKPMIHSKSLSDNRKPVVSHVEPSAIQNPKWLGLSIIAFVLVVAGAVVQAQPPKKVPRIGYLGGPNPLLDRREAFLQGLRELGYIEEKNIIIEWRSGEGKSERVPALAAELVRLKVDVIVTDGSNSTRRAKEATSTIPIVMTQDVDPVGRGIVASLARPGGNITGLSNLAPELSGKRLELLKETVPKLSRVAAFGTSNTPSTAPALKEMELAAGAFGVKVQYFDILDPKDIEIAFRATGKGRVDAVFVLVGPLVFSQRTQIAEHAAKSRLPVIYPQTEFTEVGGLMSYGLRITDLDRRAATYVDKILRGTKPADLPVEQPKKFEFIINLKTAKEIGLTIPPNVLARADKVIR